MFHLQVQEAKDRIRRIDLCADKGLENTPKSEWIFGVELDAWYSATRQLVIHVFGKDSDEYKRLELTIAAKKNLLDKACARKDPKWDFTHQTEHFQQLIGLLREFEARYDEIQSERQCTAKRPA